MQPTLKSGQIAIFLKSNNIHDKRIVLAETGDREVIKRVKLQGSEVDLYGDNPSESKDYFRIAKSSIRGVLLWPRR